MNGHPILRTNVYGDRKHIRKARGLTNAAKRLNAMAKACRRVHEKRALLDSVDDLIEAAERHVTEAHRRRAMYVPPEDPFHRAYLQTGIAHRVAFRDLKSLRVKFPYPKPITLSGPRECGVCGWRLPNSIEGFLGGCPVCMLRTCMKEYRESVKVERRDLVGGGLAYVGYKSGADYINADVGPTLLALVAAVIAGTTPISEISFSESSNREHSLTIRYNPENL